MNGKHIRAGLLGAGQAGRQHLLALRQARTARCEAVCDTVEKRARSLAREFGIPQVFTRAEDMVASGLDVVHVVLPPALHAAGAVLALEAGCHVFLEMPMGISPAECRAVEASAHHFGKVVGVNHALTCHPAFSRLLAALGEGRLGTLRHVIACVRMPLAPLVAGQHGCWMFRSPGNAVLELAPHPVSQIEVLVGPARRVSAMASGESELNTGVPFFDSWQALMQCEHGTAQLFLSFGQDRFEYRLYAFGRNGVATADIRRNTVAIDQTSPHEEAPDVLQAARKLRAWACGAFGPGAAAGADEISFRNPVLGFYEAIAEGTPLARGLACGTSVMETCQRIVAAALPVLDRAAEESLIHA